MPKEKLIDLIVVIFIAASGLLTAWVTFGILQSDATGKFDQYTVGGSIAGFLVSTSLLASLYFQIRKSSQSFQELEKRAKELEDKLIRGAPRPKGFEIEIDERQRIVLARPKQWEPRGGKIFDLALPVTEMNEGDVFPAEFICITEPITEATPAREELYKQHIPLVDSDPYVEAFSHETCRLGGSNASIKCLKVIAHQYASVVVSKSDYTSQKIYTWSTITADEFTGHIYRVDCYSVSKKPTSLLLHVSGYGFRNDATVIVNGVHLVTKVWNEANLLAIAEFPESEIPFQVSVQNPDTENTLSNMYTLAHVELKSGLDTEPSPDLEIEIESFLKEKKQPKTQPKSGKKGSSVEQNGENQIFYTRFFRMRVVCYHKELEVIFIFECFDDDNDFQATSDYFNQILTSIRFLV